MTEYVIMFTTRSNSARPSWPMDFGKWSRTFRFFSSMARTVSGATEPAGLRPALAGMITSGP